MSLDAEAFLEPATERPTTDTATAPSVRTLTGASWRAEVLDAGGPILVDFWAPWCPSCRTLDPVIRDLATRLAGRITVGKLDVDENAEIAERYTIRSIPTLIIFRNGRPVARNVGALALARLVQIVEPHLAPSRTTKTS